MIVDNELLKDDLELHEAFESIINKDDLPDYLKEISELIFVDGLNQKSLKDILEKFKIKKVEDVKNGALDLIIMYIDIILKDHAITKKERLNASLLKRFFKIKEGDFFNLKHSEIEGIICKQLMFIYEDKTVSYDEEIHIVEIMKIFDLSYDQFEKIKIQVFKSALY